MGETFDYIITGAGSAGCVLAARLTEDPDVSVLLIEAGGPDRHFLFHWPAGFAKMTMGIASWGWETVPQRHMRDRVLWYTQAKVLGGGSTINAQIYTRGNAQDYDDWRDVHGCQGWAYRDLLPYFRRAEGNELLDDDYHGADGPLGVSAPRGALPICHAFIRAAQQYGLPYNHDFNGRVQRGTGFYQVTQRDARRSSAATAFLGPARSRPNLSVLTGAEATRIVVDAGRAVAVDVVAGRDRNDRRFGADREVLVTSGAVGSPRLLMLSGIGPFDHLRSVGVPLVHDLPGVGSNYHDHLDLCVISECTGNHSYDPLARPHRAALAGLQYLLFRTGPVVSSLFETGAFWYADPESRSPDTQFHFGQGSGIEKGVTKLDNPGVTLNSAFVRPRSRGTVRLASDDIARAPLIDPNYWADPYDRDISLKGLEMAREMMRQSALAPFIRREALPGPDVTGDALFDYACRIAKTQHHPVGTCRMGQDDMAVVGPDLKVHGIEGLRVCDASIMPAITSSNTNASAIMIGEKASDLVAGRPPLPPAVLAHERNDRPAYRDA